MSILVDIRQQVGLLTLDRPERAHAYDRQHLLALRDGMAHLEESVSVVVISSTGARAFCGGADLSQLHDADPLDALDLLSQRVFSAIAASPVITIAAVQGAAVAGGCELALACDLRVVGPAASFSLPETALGLIPSAGGCTRLTRLVGPGRAKEVILGGASIDAETAVAWGLAGRLVADPRPEALAMAERIAGRDPVALRLAKQIIDHDEDPRSLAAERLAEALLYARRRH
jgi:enoyl-CoA hydratase